jgi:hypothetical protein
MAALVQELEVHLLTLNWEEQGHGHVSDQPTGVGKYLQNAISNSQVFRGGLYENNCIISIQRHSESLTPFANPL